MGETDRETMMEELAICTLIPTFNNEKTLAKVIETVLAYCPQLIVVNDGSTDSTPSILECFAERIRCVSYKKNRGKGYALRRGLEEAKRCGFTHVITLDSDGQHFPEDIPLFVEAAKQHPDALIVGSRDLQAENMPEGNSFANRFSNFWFHLQTGINLPDTQTGYRLYPLNSLPLLCCLGRRYEAELMLLVRSAWKNVQLQPIAVRVYYPPAGERVSHFKPFADFFRISILNTFLSLAAIFYAWPLKFLRKIGGRHD